MAWLIGLGVFFLAMWIRPRRVVVRWQERGLLLRKGRMVRVLDPGSHWVWPLVPEEVRPLDVRPRMLQIKGQEVATSESLSVRVSVAGTYRIDDPLQYLDSGEKPEEVLYLQLQLVLRDLVGDQTVEQVVAGRGALTSLLLEKAQVHAAAAGVTWTVLGIKDVVLPADVKEMHQGVVQAKKKAEARLAAAREELAIARVQANLVRMMEEHPLLLHLQELEAVKGLASKPANTILAPVGLWSTAVGQMLPRKAGVTSPAPEPPSAPATE